jgi:hypothetical protein
LVAAVAQGQDVELALGALPPSVRAQFTTPQGMADASFSKLYDELRRIDPAF